MTRWETGTLQGSGNAGECGISEEDGTFRVPGSLGRPPSKNGLSNFPILGNVWDNKQEYDCNRKDNGPELETHVLGCDKTTDGGSP